MKLSPLFVALLLILPTPRTRAQTTAPADSPAPAAMAPTYLNFGEQLSLRLGLVRQTLGELSLDPAVLNQANQIVDSANADLKQLMVQIQSGNMPGMHRLMAVPDNLRAAREKLLAVIGPDQASLLQEKLRSLRGEARAQLAWLDQQIADLNLPSSVDVHCQSILKDCQSSACNLPDTDIQGDQYAAARTQMNQLFIKAHAELSQFLSESDEARLGDRFAAMASPTTQPISGG
jgi:hypothetical protein